MNLVSDHGSQATSKAYMEAAKLIVFFQIFGGYCTPKGNAVTERIIMTIKEEDWVSPREWPSYGELAGVLGEMARRV